MSHDNQGICEWNIDGKLEFEIMITLQEMHMATEANTCHLFKNMKTGKQI